MKDLLKYIVYILFRLMAFIPLRVLYVFSDLIIYPLVYYVIRYRVKLTRKNLKNSFPEKTQKELRKIERRFYRNFCDLVFESLAVVGMSEKESLKHMQCENIELLRKYLNQKKSVFLLLGHYENWEYLIFLGLLVKDLEKVETIAVYRPLNNGLMDLIFKKIRSRFGCNVVSKRKVYKYLSHENKDGKTYAVGMVADQTPSKANLHYWTNFLNQDTAMLIGTERMAKTLDVVTLYVDIQVVSRGYYKCTLKLISDKPRETKEFEITEKYARLLEKTIQRCPEGWLWTHKRWKYKHIK